MLGKKFYLHLELAPGNRRQIPPGYRTSYTTRVPAGVSGWVGTPTPLICNYIAMKCRNSGNSLWMRYKLLEEQRTLTFLH